MGDESQGLLLENLADIFVFRRFFFLYCFFNLFYFRYGGITRTGEKKNGTKKGQNENTKDRTMLYAIKSRHIIGVQGFKGSGVQSSKVQGSKAQNSPEI
jgi:hypothetical protein